jgi:F-type H+-transporting ATPase subunit b
MTLNWWGLGLQAINVLILVWLLSRVFWRPVAGVIARRQRAAREMLDEGETAKAKAEAMLAEVAQTRAGIAAERDAILAEARTQADTAAKAALTQAQTRAETLLSAAHTAIERDREDAHKQNARQAAALSARIAARLLARFDTPAVRAAFLEHLSQTLATLPARERTALAASKAGLEIVTAAQPEDAQKAAIEQAIRDALGSAPELRFVTDPDLIAGLELRGAHFVLHNSWRADIEQILKEIGDAA